MSVLKPLSSVQCSLYSGAILTRPATMGFTFQDRQYRGSGNAMHDKIDKCNQATHAIISLTIYRYELGE